MRQQFSETVLSIVSGITVESRNIAEQTRERLLVTHLPKAPFFALIVLNLLYALRGVLLAIIALASQPRSTRNIQARLSIGGLVAPLLEPTGKGNTLPGKISNSGIESAFAEYYNDDKHHDDRRVIFSPKGGNTMFEKVSSQNITNDKVESVTGNSSQVSGGSPPRPLPDMETDMEASNNLQPEVFSAVVRRKPVAQRLYSPGEGTNAP